MLKASELPKLSNNSNLKRSRTIQKQNTVSRDNHEQNISCKTVHYGKSSISIFEKFFAIIDKIFNLGERLGTRLKFYEVLIFF